MKGINTPLFSTLKKGICLSVLLLGLAACSDSSTSSDTVTISDPPETTSPAPTPTPTADTVSGTVTAPSGVVARLRKPTFFEMIFPPAYAGVLGLLPASNATVELILVDDNGNQVGDVIATASTSAAGAFSINLPSGVSLAGNLVLRVQGGGVKMHAIAIENKVDINPSSHYAYQSLIDSDLVMAQLAANHVVTLRGYIDEFQVNAGSDINNTLAALHLAAGYRIKQELAVLKTTAGDASLFTGAWRNGAFGLALHDEDSGFSGSIATSVEMIEYLIASETSEAISLTPQSYSYKAGILKFSQQGSNIGSSFTHLTEGSPTVSSPQTLNADVRSNGSFVARAPLKDVFYDDQGTGSGPTLGTRTFPLTLVFESGGSSNVKVGINEEKNVNYFTKDSNGNGVFDAIDLTKKRGDEPHLLFELFIRNSTGLSHAILNAKMGIVRYELLQSSLDSSVFVSTQSSILSFDGTGSVSAPINAIKQDKITRTPTTISFSNNTQSDAILGTYSVTSDGALTLTETVNNPMTGFVSPSGDLLLAVQTTSGLSFHRQVYSLGVKLGDTPPSLSGAKYKLYPMEIGYRADDTEILTFAHPGVLTFNAAGTQATLADNSFGIIRDSDLGQIAPPSDNRRTMLMEVNVLSDSSASMVFDDGTSALTFDGFVSGDASRMILKLKETKSLGTSDAYYGLGFVFAVKVN